MARDCVFCRIVDGELPCTKVHEDASTLAFMDIGPIIKGHTLVIPKAHSTSIVDTPAHTLQELIAVVQKIADAQLRGLEADGINVTQANGSPAGQVVPHIHFHVIPRFASDGHSWNWKPRNYGNDDEMAAYADKIRAVILKPN